MKYLNVLKNNMVINVHQSQNEENTWSIRTSIARAHMLVLKPYLSANNSQVVLQRIAVGDLAVDNLILSTGDHNHFAEENQFWGVERRRLNVVLSCRVIQRRRQHFGQVNVATAGVVRVGVQDGAVAARHECLEGARWRWEIATPIIKREAAAAGHSSSIVHLQKLTHLYLHFKKRSSKGCDIDGRGLLSQ